MISIVRDKDGNIKTFQDSLLEDYDRSLGETIEFVESSMLDYSRRFYLSSGGKSGETITAYQAGPDVPVIVSCPGQSKVDVSINGLIETVDLVDGVGRILLSTANWGIFDIMPADRKTYCAAGNGRLTIEVFPYV